MRTKLFIMLCVSLFVFIALPVGVHALDLVVEFDGECSSVSSSSSSLNLPASCGNLSFSTGSQAREIGDTSRDLLMLLGTTITTSQANTDYQITVKREFTELPKTPPGEVFYKATAQGAFGSTSAGGSPADGSWVTMSAYVRNPMGGSWEQIGSSKTMTVDCGAGACDKSVTLVTSEEWSDDLLSNRELKFVLDFNLKSTTTKLQLTPGGVKLINTASGDPDITLPPEGTCEEPGGCFKVPFIMTTYSTTQAFSPQDPLEGLNVKKSTKVKRFASSSWENLSQDMAKGDGEYLASLGSLLEIPQDQQSAFFVMAQEEYQRICEHGIPTAETAMDGLYTAMATHSALADYALPPGN